MCRTDLHLRDHEIEATKLPVCSATRSSASTEDGRRVGVPWLGWTDGECRYCTSGRENLCVNAQLHRPRHRRRLRRDDTVADERFCLPLPDELCRRAGGAAAVRRADRLPRADARPATRQRLGLYGFGSAAHMICQVAVYQGREVFAFTRAGDTRTQEFARSLGAAWAGGSDEAPPEPLDARDHLRLGRRARPAGAERARPRRVVVCAGIHMTDIPSFPYETCGRSARSARSPT